jgi:hypothetical protein
MSTHSISAQAPTAAPRDGLLRGAFKADAVASVGSGLAYIVANGPVSDLLGLPSAFLLVVGAFSFLYGSYAWYLGTRPRVSPSAGRLIATGNLGWAAASIAMAVIGWHDPTTAGTVWIVMQGLLVGGFADAQLLGARRITR